MNLFTLLTYLLFNVCVHCFATSIAEVSQISIFLGGWFITSAMHSLSFCNGLLALLIMGLYLDGDGGGQFFGISPLLLCAIFTYLKYSDFHFKCNKCSSITLLNACTQCLFLAVIASLNHSIKIILYSWPTLLVSALFLACTNQILIRLQNQLIKSHF